MKEQKLLLVDGMALLFRAYFANSYGGYIRKTAAGVPTNAVYGFVKYFLDAVRTFRPTHVACCWDMGSKTFRSERFAGYKANRPEPPGELIPQFEIVKEVVDCFQVPNISHAGFEADDCIGTLSRRFGEQMDVLVLTGDHDLLQLVTERVRVAIMKKGMGNYAVYDPQTLLETKQLNARQFIDLKGLIGDKSDNYPGVRGIGEKTAVKLLLEYESIDGILERLSELPKGVRAKLEADRDMLLLCRELATIRCDAPIDCKLEDSLWNPNAETIRSKFEELEFKGLLQDLAKTAAAS